MNTSVSSSEGCEKVKVFESVDLVVVVVVVVVSVDVGVVPGTVVQLPIVFI